MPETETKIWEIDRAPRRDIQLIDDRTKTNLNKRSLGILWKLPIITNELYEELQIESYIYPYNRPRTEIDRLQKGLKKDLYKPCKEFLKKHPFFLEKLKKYKNCSTYRRERWLRWYNLNEFLKAEVPNNLEDMINGDPYLLL